MHSILTVSVPATETDLTTLGAVKTALGIADDDTADDLMISEQIERVSAAIASYLGVRSDASGNATLARETLVETFRSGCWREGLLLSRYPVASISSVVADAVALTAGDYEVDARTGMLYRLDGSDERTGWHERKIVVTYVAGWLLPDESGRNLPRDIEDAAIAMIAAARSLRSRGDVMARAESVVGVGSIDYQVPSGEDAGFPAEARAKLDRYRVPAFG